MPSELLDVTLITVGELVWVHRLVSSDDPFERELGWAFWACLKKREAQRKK